MLSAGLCRSPLYTIPLVNDGCEDGLDDAHEESGTVLVVSFVLKDFTVFAEDAVKRIVPSNVWLR